MEKYHEIRQKKIGTCQNSSGFTLIEILVVIGIIAVLATVVLVAVNPARQFKLARDTQRTSNMQAIINAVHQNMAEHKGSFICNNVIRPLPTTATLIKSSTSPDPGDIASCIVPDYISAIPFDPSMAGAYYNSPADYYTGYYISIDSHGRLTASSTGELTPSITATR